MGVPPCNVSDEVGGEEGTTVHGVAAAGESGSPPPHISEQVSTGVSHTKTHPQVQRSYVCICVSSQMSEGESVEHDMRCTPQSHITDQITAVRA